MNDRVAGDFRNLIDKPRFQTALKALLLLGLAAFLYTRLAGGTLFYYINERFVAYTMLAIVGLLLVGISYRPVGRKRPAGSEPASQHEHSHEHSHDHSHGDAHSHAGDGATHHVLTWAGAGLVLLPILLGVLVPPQPLGVAALANREVNVTMQGSALPAAVQAAAAKQATDKTVLDWLHTFSGSPDPAQAFAGEPAQVVGFVFRDERFAEDQFMVTRFVVSCCVADANVAGLVVRWPDATTLSDDQWVEVSGTLQHGVLGEEVLPVLAAQTVMPVDPPQQPYLYP
jgi:uncharacterized repeat protein (TIGR03943 family)